MSLKKSTVQSRKRDLFIETPKQLRPLKTTYQRSNRVPTQVCKVWSRMFMISGLWKDDNVAGNVRWNTFSFRSNSCFCRNPSIFTNTELFFFSQGRVARPDARFNSPVNGLESSALLLQFNTVLIYLFIYTVYIYIFIFTSSTVILFVWLKRPK